MCLMSWFSEWSKFWRQVFHQRCLHDFFLQNLPADALPDGPVREKMANFKRPKKFKTSENDFSHGSFFLRIGGIGKSIHSGLIIYRLIKTKRGKKMFLKDPRTSEKSVSQLFIWFHVHFVLILFRFIFLFCNNIYSYRVFTRETWCFEHLLGHQKCTFKS